MFLEKLIDEFLTDDYLLPMIDETLDGFSTIPNLNQQRLKMLTGDIKIDIVFILYSHGWMTHKTWRICFFILKQLPAEELLSPEQFEQLSELEQMDLPTIALVIKDTKVGQGLNSLPRKLTDLKQQLEIWLKDLVETGHSETRKQVAAVLEELLKRNGISLD